MRLIKRLEKAQWERKRFKQFLLLILVSALMPTPAVGFILGGLITTVLMTALRGLLQAAPLVWAVIIGVAVASLALIWQGISDHYWRRQ